MKKGVPMEKRGAELSLNFIILAILAVIVLIGIVFFFLGGAEFFAKKEKGTAILTDQDRALAEAACNLHCTIGNKAKWDAPGFQESVSAKFVNCEELMAQATPSKSWSTDCAAPEPA